MRISVIKQDFAKTLNLASRFVNQRAQLPILGNIVLKTTGTSLTVMATNLESSVVAKLGAKVDEPGEIAVPAKIIVDLVSNLEMGQVNLETDKEQLKITTADFEGRVSGINTADFPNLPDTLSTSISISAQDISRALSKVAFSVSLDETRPILTGVLFLFDKKSLTVVSSDGFRLSLTKLDLKVDVKPSRVVIPKNAIMELIKLAQETQGEVKMEIKDQENQVVFGVGDIVFSTRTLEGEFPNYEKIIPNKSDVHVHVDKTALARAVKLASVFARDASNIAKVVVSKDGLEVVAESAKSGQQKTQLEAKVEGLVENLEINFNYRFIEEALNVVEADNLILEFNNISSPGVVTDTKNPNFLHLIMPVKIQG